MNIQFISGYVLIIIEIIWYVANVEAVQIHIPHTIKYFSSTGILQVPYQTSYINEPLAWNKTIIDENKCRNKMHIENWIYRLIKNT